MKKDPAILFYTQDFLTGVQDLTMEERGQYITLLCLHHQKGRLKLKAIKVAVPGVSEDVLAKFDIDGDGLYYNKRLEEEKQRRDKYRKNQSERAKESWKKRRSDSPAYADPHTKLDANLDDSASVRQMPQEKMKLKDETIKEEGVEGKKDQMKEDMVKIFQFLSSQVEGTFKAVDIRGNATRYGLLLKDILKYGYTPKQVCDVIIHKVREWGDDDNMKKFLKPKTLFAMDKFSNYVDEVPDDIVNRAKGSLGGKKQSGIKGSFGGFA